METIQAYYRQALLSGNIALGLNPLVILQLDINNRFAIYYPEKRPFFLEGADFFNTQHSLVHTRTLADPNWGIKITGKEGPNAIGFFTVQDNLTNFLFPGSEGSSSGSIDNNSIDSVFRYRRDLFESSNMGIIFTDREGDHYYNRVGGIDGDFRFTQKDRFRFTAINMDLWKYKRKLNYEKRN